MRISRAVREKSRFGRCGTTPISNLTATWFFQTSYSPIHACPLVGRTRVVSTPTVVDLPAPFGPSRQKISPAITSSEIPSSAVICSLGCFDPLALERAIMPPAAPSGGAELKTLRRSCVRIPIGMESKSQLRMWDSRPRLSHEYSVCCMNLEVTNIKAGAG